MTVDMAAVKRLEGMLALAKLKIDEYIRFAMEEAGAYSFAFSVIGKHPSLGSIDYEGLSRVLPTLAYEWTREMCGSFPDARERFRHLQERFRKMYPKHVQKIPTKTVKQLLTQPTSASPSSKSDKTVVQLCPLCYGELTYPLTLAGKVQTCPICKQRVTLSSKQATVMVSSRGNPGQAKISHPCQECGKRMNCSVASLGRHVGCPACHKQVFVVPCTLRTAAEFLIALCRSKLMQIIDAQNMDVRPKISFFLSQCPDSEEAYVDFDNRVRSKSGCNPMKIIMGGDQRITAFTMQVFDEWVMDWTNAILSYWNLYY